MAQSKQPRTFQLNMTPNKAGNQLSASVGGPVGAMANRPTASDNVNRIISEEQNEEIQRSAPWKAGARQAMGGNIMSMPGMDEAERMQRKGPLQKQLESVRGPQYDRTDFKGHSEEFNKSLNENYYDPAKKKKE